MKQLENNEIELNKMYWICDESASVDNMIFEIDFDYKDEPLDRWDWAVYTTEEGALEHKVNCLNTRG